MRLTTRILSALVVLTCASAGAAQWQDPSQPYRDSLKQLDRLILRVDLAFSDALPDDPREREITDLVKRRLADAGINVTVKERWEEDADRDAVLHLDVYFIAFDIFYHQSNINLELTQQTSLSRNPTLKLRARTWYSGSGGMGTPSIRNEIREVVDRFICDFRQANPDIKAPLPKCPSEDAMDRREPDTGKRPSVMTKLEDQLIRAAVFGEVKEAKALIARGADVNAHDHNDATPLWYAVRSGNRRIGETAVIELLLENGANPNITVSCRLTPLMNAVDRGDVKVVKLLLDHGADVNGVTGEGYTALMAAAMLGSPEIVSMLLSKGASVAAKAHDGTTALSLALSNRDRIAPFDRPTSFDNPYVDIPEAELLKRAQAKHDKVAGLLKDAGAKD